MKESHVCLEKGRDDCKNRISACSARGRERETIRCRLLIPSQCKKSDVMHQEKKRKTSFIIICFSQMRPIEYIQKDTTVIFYNKAKKGINKLVVWSYI